MNSKKDKNEGPLIIEERIMKVNGEISIRKYAKNRLLGKVNLIISNREGLLNVVNYRTLKQRK